MGIGNNLLNARKKKGLSQEEVAAKLGVSRQTISKWELDETIPDIYQSKKLAMIYNLSLDELIIFDIELKTIEEVIMNSNEKKDSKIDWNKAWGKKYPILLSDQENVEIDYYASEIKKLLIKIQRDYNYSSLDSMLVLKDILAKVWHESK
ncbi:helix-turn-helix transcriptional regulator [Erysipelotrichaceae bacterium OttesenSCG-928-M19]|nr:helix-turn-helix transcriptional regulator [Erysipelotrichaceae bacterium OttesenSCG-928-M19]